MIEWKKCYDLFYKVCIIALFALSLGKKGNILFTNHRIDSNFRYWFLLSLLKCLVFLSVSTLEARSLCGACRFMFHRCVFCSGKPIFSFTNYKQSNFASGEFFLLENPFNNASGLVSQDEIEICLAGKMWVNFHVYDSWRKINRKKKLNSVRGGK